MNDLMERLKVAKVKLEGAEKEKIVIETKIEGLQTDLENLGYDTVSGAEKAMMAMEEEIATLEDTLGEMINDFESKYHRLLAN